MPCMDAKFIDPYAFLDRFAYEVHKFKNLALSMILLLQGLCCVRMLQVIVASVITKLTACKRNLFNVLFCAWWFFSLFSRASDEEVVDDMMARVRPSGGTLECKQSTVSLQFNEQAEVRAGILQLAALIAFCLELSANESLKFSYSSTLSLQTQNSLVHGSFLPGGYICSLSLVYDSFLPWEYIYLQSLTCSW